MNTFRIRATNVRENSIRNVALYPPVVSRTLLETVAIRDPPITVKVMRAIFVEKYFMPKKEEVKAAVIVGQDPYDIPVRQSPAIQSGKDTMVTAKRVTPAAQIVRMFAHSIVLRRPMVSKTAPVRIRPKPLHTERIPTRVTARDSGAFTESAKSLAKLITELPTAAKKEIQINAIQNDGRRSI